MSDIVRDKFQMKLDAESDHEVANVYFERVARWYNYLYRKDEL